MRTSWVKWVLIVAALLISSGGKAHDIADHAPCAVHEHHHDSDHHHHAAGHQECCCTSGACLSVLVMPAEPDAPYPVAYSLHLAPELASPLASRSPSPELDPPRPSALS